MREASLAERRKYLELFPRVRLIACRRTAAGWFACSANRGDARFQIDGLVPIRIASDVQQFDTLIARFDGAQFWFDELDIRANPTQARDLRESLEQRALPEDVKSSGLSAEQRAAFELCYWLSAAGRQNRRSRAPTQRNIEIEQSINYGDPVRSRLTDSLSHAGARLVSYVERNDSYQIIYEVNGQNYTSAIDKDNMTVFSAGICLAGEDEKFDLTSLVGVLREGQRTGQIYDD